MKKGNCKKKENGDGKRKRTAKQSLKRYSNNMKIMLVNKTFLNKRVTFPSKERKQTK